MGPSASYKGRPHEPQPELTLLADLSGNGCLHQPAVDQGGTLMKHVISVNTLSPPMRRSARRPALAKPGF
jgi:hypothetical protein